MERLFAEIDSTGVVIRVLVFTADATAETCAAMLGGVWQPANRSDGHASVGDTWDDSTGVFVAPPAPPPAEPSRGIPFSVTRRQLKQWLVLNGQLAAVEAALVGIADETDRQLAQIWWADATEFERAHPLVAQVGAVLGMTAEQIDAAFTEAAQL